MATCFSLGRNHGLATDNVRRDKIDSGAGDELLFSQLRHWLVHRSRHAVY